MTKQIAQRLTQIIGIYQILGGALGIGLGLYKLGFNFRLNIFFIFYDFLNLVLSAFCLISGVFCFRNPLQGLTITFYNQLLQLIVFTFSGFTYMFNPGLGLLIGADISSAQFIFQFKLPHFYFGKSYPDKAIILVNIIPALVGFTVEPIKKIII